MIAGVLTANELALLRTRPQRTQLYIAIPEYKTIYTARLNVAPASNDKVFSINFDGGAGTLANVVSGMMLLVGTSAGAWDVGIARIRDDSLDLGGGTGTLFIGITSEIEWVDDLYLTVLDDFSLWPRHPYVSAIATYMDYGIAYTNQNQAGPPVPIMGSHAVLELTGATVSTTFDASDSYSCIGTPASYDYAWYVDGVLVSNADAVTISFSAVGTYLVKLEVTANYSFCVAGPESISYRYVIVHDCEHPLNSSFVLDSCEGDFESGGWSYGVTMNANAAEANVRDRTLCLLVAKDWYGDTQQSIGPLDGRENIVCTGWIDGESLRRSNDKSMVSFEVQGPSFWLGMQEGFPTGIDDTDAAPTDWNHIEELDPRKGLFSFLYWRTTTTMVTDCYITDDDHRLATTYTPAGTLLEQLRSIAERVNAKTVCDRYGRLFCEIDIQFIDPALRVPPTFPVVQTLSNRDWRDEITIERRIVNDVGQVDLSGVHWSGTVATSAAIFSLSPGHIPTHYGEKRQIERIALDDQAEANTLAGLWLGYMNNEYPHIDTPMSSNYRAIDIAPRMFMQMNLAAGDTPRGITWTNKKLIPRRVSFNYDAGEALLLTDITFEAEAFPSDAVTGDPPIEPPAPPIIVTPPPPTLCNDSDAINFGGLAPCIYPAGADIVVVMTTAHIAWSSNAISDPASANWNDITPPGISGLKDFVLSDTGELWMAVHTGVIGDAYEGIWYTPGLTSSALSRILSSAQARIEGGDASISFNLHSMCMIGTECWVAPENAMHAPDTDTFHYWHGNNAMTHATCVVTPKVNTDTQGTSCTDGITARYGMNSFGAGSWIIDIAACNEILQPFPGGLGGNIGSASENYMIHDGTNIYNIPAWTVAYAGGNFTYQLLELGGHLYWIRNADGALMQDGSMLSIPNDAGGVTGVFSNAGATSGGFISAGTSDTMIWIAHSNDVSNAYCNMALTQDGGATWVSIDGDWNVVVAPYDGGAVSVPTVVRYASV